MDRNEFYSGWVFKLIVINVLFFAVQIFSGAYYITYSIQGYTGQSQVITFFLGLIPSMVAEKGYIWQVFSYMFLHSTEGFAHLFFNMYALLIFGFPIEQAWGSKRFLGYYLYCGVVAGICIFAINFISQGIGYHIPTIGASGAVFGLLLAFGMLYPDAEILLFFFLPIKAKYLVVLYGGLELYMEFSGGQGGISHVGHLGGLFAGLVYFFMIKRKQFLFKARLIKSKAESNLKKHNRILNPDHGKDKIKDMEKKAGILRQLKSEGLESLSDDDIQYIKHLVIMSDIENNDDVCAEADFIIEDDHCRNCERFEACFIREIKKYLK